MLDTVMALWNRRQKENKQKISKIGLTVLFICISASLLLVGLSARSSEKHAVVEKKDAQQPLVLLPDATASELPTPSPTVRVAERITQSCVQLPTPIVTPPVKATHGAVFPVINNGAWHAPSYPKHTFVKMKKKHHATRHAAKRHHRSRPHKSATPTPTATATRTPTVTVTATSTLTPTASPVATATVSVTPSLATPEPLIQPFISGFVQRLVPISYIGHIGGSSTSNGPEKCRSNSKTQVNRIPPQHNKRWLLGSSLSLVVLFGFGAYMAERKKRFVVLTKSQQNLLTTPVVHAIIPESSGESFTGRFARDKAIRNW